jgi:hypothetical protein
MIKKTALLSSAALLTIFVNTAQADWQGLLNDAASGLMKDKSTTQTASSLLTNNEMVSGLKEALANGVESSVKNLGKKDGFMGNSLVKIPLPASLKLIEETAREHGQGEYVDQLIITMNHAAEAAVPDASELLGEAIRKMSVEDAEKIINGPDDAATQYFRKVSSSKLEAKFKPVIEESTSKIGVISAYKSLISQVTPALGNSMLTSFIPTNTLDVDQYVTDKTLDGLFKYIALEEKSIRKNPAARTTDLLKKVFSTQ